MLQVFGFSLHAMNVVTSLFGIVDAFQTTLQSGTSCFVRRGRLALKCLPTRSSASDNPQILKRLVTVHLMLRDVVLEILTSWYPKRWSTTNREVSPCWKRSVPTFCRGISDGVIGSKVETIVHM